jgi:shikimate kinase
MDYKNISLIGFMGSGKSTIGKILAEKKSFLFVDIDRLIELEEEKSIKDIFKIYGEDYFRDLESKVINKVYSNNHCIFACGGGVVNREQNMKIIRGNSLVIYLRVSPDNVFIRLKDVQDRPLINVKDRKDTIIKLIGKRDKLYERYAHIIVNNDDNDPGRSSEEILDLIKD